MKNIDYDIPIFESNDLADLDLYSEKMATAIKGQIDKITTNVDGKVTEIQDNIEEINKKDTEQDNKIVELQNEKIELEKELKEIQEDFYQSSIRGQASGEYIHVEDSSNCRARIGISGNSEQETYIGKNLYSLLSEQTINGIKVSHNEDGTFNLIGTATAETFIVVSTTKFLNDKKVYTISKNTTNIGMVGYEYNINTWLQTFVSIGKSEKSKTFTYNKNSNMTRNVLQINIANGTVLNETNIKIMLEESSNETEWEPYVGGIPSPNPDYPSEIKTVGDNVNLLDVSKIGVRTSYGITFTQTDTGIKITGTAEDTYAYGTSIKCNLQKGKTYTLYGKNAGNTFKLELKKSGTVIMNIKTSGDKVTFTSKEDIDSITFVLEGISKGTTYNYEISNIKIVEGTEVGGYSKYGMGSTKITKCNKNRVGDIQKGYWNNTGVFEYDTNFVSSKQIKVEKGKTYIGGLFDKNKNYVGKTAYVLFDKNKNFIRYSGEETITIGDNEEYVSIRTYSAQASYITSNNYLLQLEVGNKTSSYEEHQEQSYIVPMQQPFRAIGDIRDTFIKKDGKWYERHNIYRYTFTGNETWQYQDGETIFGFLFNDFAPRYLVNNTFNCYSNRFVKTTQWNLPKVQNGIAFSQWNGNQYVYLPLIENSIAKLKTYLLNNETYVDYPLETPIDIECTEEQSQILEELNNARTYKNVTNITTDSKAILSLDYVKDLETLLNNTQALAVNNASEGV